MAMCDMGYWFPDETKWTVVYDAGVSWRSSPNYGDKAAGKGPKPGDHFKIVQGNVVKGRGPSGDDLWFIKASPSAGMFLFLPCNTPGGRPIMRPTVQIPSYSEKKMWKVVYPEGVGTRKSNHYQDRDIGDDGEPAVVFDEGRTFQGWAMPGENDGPEMVRIHSEEGYINYVPLTTEDGTPVCEDMGMAPQGGAPASGFGGPPMGAPPSGYGAPPSGYGAPPSGYGAPPSGYGAPPSGYGAPPTGYPAPAPQSGWQQLSSNGRPYWFNPATNETTWTDPFARAAPAPPASGGWQQYMSGGRPYWSNGSETTWTDPTAWTQHESGGRPYWANIHTRETTWQKPY